jgi:hypothetical protein
MEEENRGNLYLVTGIVIGLALGLLFSWVIQPVQYLDTSPDSLKGIYQDQYRAVIAAAFEANQDMVRAKARLELLGDEDIVQAVAEQAQRALAEGGSAGEVKALGQLATALGRSIPKTAPTETAGE